MCSSDLNVLHQTNTHFYTEEGLKELKQHIKPDGVFAMWADGAPEDFFTERLSKIGRASCRERV